MSSALHGLLAVLLWLGMSAWPRDAAVADGEAHVLQRGAPAPTPGLLAGEVDASTEDDNEDSEDPGDAPRWAPRIDPDTRAPRASPRDRGTRADAIPRGAGSIRGPPDTCPFRQA